MAVSVFQSGATKGRELSKEARVEILKWEMMQACLQCPTSSLAAPIKCPVGCSTSSFTCNLQLSRRKAVIFLTASLFIPNINFNPNPPNSAFVSPSAARELDEEEEARVVHLFEEISPSVVFIEILELPNTSNRSKDIVLTDETSARVEGTGSGFLWDKFGHIVTNYHVVAKLATDKSGLQCCKADSDGKQIKPAILGTSNDLRVGQSCFAIGNPYGYENTLTTGVVSGLGREIPSPNGQAIRGAIQTDAAISAGNSGGPLIDSNGHVIGVNTTTFTRKGTRMSSGVNFAIPIDMVVRTVPYLIVYGTPYSNRY